jgi:hypothetical protein
LQGLVKTEKECESMQLAWTRQLRAAGFAGALALAVVIVGCQQFGPYQDCSDGECAQGARVCNQPTVRALAHDLDDLENRIERNGSVVAQHPSVWGQARLTRHREEFEKQMFLELGNFHATLQ